MSSELGVERPTTLPLPEPQESRRVHFGAISSAFISEDKTHTSTKDADFRPKRLRSASFSAPGEYRYGNKRRKKYRVLPSKFLLGGNITDPLNLGSLDREGASQLGLVEGSGGAAVKKSNAVRVIIPPNINDPLNLDVSSDNEDSLNDALLRQLRRRRRNRKRKRRLSEPSGEVRETIGCEPLRSESLEECQIANSETELLTPISEVLPKITVDKLQPLSVDTELSTPIVIGDEQQKEPVGQPTPTTPGAKPSTSGFQRPAFKKQRCKSDNKIVSPVIPQPGVDRKRHPSHSRQHVEQPHLSQQNLKPPKKFNPKNELFQYGNYNKYYGYRNPNMTPDMRLNFLRRDWFEGKDILDVGCNIGHITLTIAKDFNPKSVVGLDIDKKLVNIAQKNIKHYMQMGDMEETNFPKSMRLLYGALKAPATVEGGRQFPYNVKFVHANYVLESDELLETVRPEFDVIMCLSITKWVHLNYGDPGLKRFFRRVFYNLKPGGRLILEPQGWPSYSKRKKLTMRIFENYKNIRLFPDKFNDYLLHVVGFSTSEKIITPQHMSRGFQRPIIVYTKAGVSSKSSSSFGRKSRESNVKCGNAWKQLDFSSVPNVKQESSKIVQKMKEECFSAIKSKNDRTNSLNDCSKADLNLAQNDVQADGSSSSNVSAVKVEAMDCASNSQCDDGKNETFKVENKECVSNSQCGDDTNETTFVKMEKLDSKKGSADFVCDNSNKKKSSSDGSGSLLTHSRNHNPNQCVVKSPSCSSEIENVHMNKTDVSKAVNSSISKPGNDVGRDSNRVQNVESISCNDKGRTSLGSNNSPCLSATMESKLCETQDTVCEKSNKSNFGGDVKHDGLLSVTESRSPEK